MPTEPAGRSPETAPGGTSLVFGGTDGVLSEPPALLPLSSLTGHFTFLFHPSLKSAPRSDRIAFYQAVLASAPDLHYHRSKVLFLLAKALLGPYGTGTAEIIGDMDQVISHLREALKLQPEAPLLEDILHLLSVCHIKLGEKSGDTASLQDAILLMEEAHARTTRGRTRGIVSSNLATALRIRFLQMGDVQDLERAIALQEAELKLHPAGHPDHDQNSGGLATSLVVRFGWIAKLDDLVRAIDLFREALVCSKESGEQGLILNNLAICLWERYNSADADADLNECIALGERALSLLPNDARPLNNLGGFFGTRFDRTQELSDLSKAIELQRQCLSIVGTQGPARSTAANNLAHGLSRRFSVTKDVADATEAAMLYGECLRQHPDPDATNGLGHLYFDMYLATDDVAHLKDALNVLETTLAPCPVDHPTYGNQLGCFANAAAIALLVVDAYDVEDHSATPLIRRIYHLLSFRRPRSDNFRCVLCALLGRRLIFQIGKCSSG